ncbi:hypothetical protein JCM19037_4259 [Geomicrobium sp. JCM 19037]|nr:hypothetical protein JCM19037_4259 [Geomicrobium sp. JCM 19037]
MQRDENSRKSRRGDAYIHLILFLNNSKIVHILTGLEIPAPDRVIYDRGGGANVDYNME